MLSDHPIDVILLAKDLPEAKAFYADKIGLEVLNEFEEAGGRWCRVQMRPLQPAGGDRQHDGLQRHQYQGEFPSSRPRRRGRGATRRGVKIEDYDTPELKTED